MADPLTLDQLRELRDRVQEALDAPEVAVDLGLREGPDLELFRVLVEAAQQFSFVLAVVDESARYTNEIEAAGDMLMRELNKVGYGNAGAVKKWKEAKG